MAFKSLDEVYQNYLELPGREGKLYRVPEADFATGLWCTEAFMLAKAVIDGAEIPADAPQLRLDGDEELAMHRKLLGDELLEELKGDGHGKPTIDLFATTAFLWHAAGREMAEQYWNAGGRAEDFSRGPLNRAGRRHPSTGTAAESTTKPRASGSGTRSPRKSAPR